MIASKKIFAYQHNIEKYRRDTGMLSLQQHGAYRMLMDEFYLTGGLLPNVKSQLYRIASCQNLSERKAVDYVLSKYWKDRGDGYLTQKFAENELKRISKVSEENSKNATMKYDKSNTYESQAHSDRICELNANHEPVTSNHIEDISLEGSEINLPNPKKETQNAKPKRPRKPATFITEEFIGDIKSIDLAQRLGVDFESEQRKFINYWLAKGKSMCDWQAAFRNWLGKAAEYRNERIKRELVGRQNVRDVTGASLRAIASRNQTINRS